MPNNREWALLLWLAAIGVWALTRRDVRSGFADVLRTAAGPKTLVPLACMAAWVSLEVWLGAQFQLWVPSLATSTAIWFVSSGLVLFFKFDDASKDPRFFQRKARAALGPVVLVGLLVDAIVLPFPAELLLQPVAALLVMLAVVASTEEQYRLVKKLASGLIGLIGLTLIGYSFLNIVAGWHGLDKGDLFLQAALPVWLTLGLLPFVYAVALYASYELAFLRVDWKSQLSRRARLWSKLALLIGFHVRAQELASFGGAWQQRIATASSFREARGVVRAFRYAQQEAARAEVEARARLIRFAGVDGADEKGRRLDRREFEETTDALRWLATCMMGWYHREKRYRADLLGVLEDDFTGHGLGPPSGIAMRVAKNGQAWYAWRRTVTGWCFAIGAAGPPPDQWEYDGPEPATGFPGRDRSWGSAPFSDGASPNWWVPGAQEVR